MNDYKNSASWAKLISFLTNPAFVVIVCLAVISERYATTFEQAFRWTVLATILLVLPGFTYVTATTWSRENHIDIDVTRREDRVIPLMLATLGAVVAGSLISTRLISPQLVLLSQILVAMLVSLTIVTLLWKISLHAATFSALVTLLVLYGGLLFATGYVILLPIAWSRLVLKQHTPLQLTGGAIVGVVVTLLSALVLGK